MCFVRISEQTTTFALQNIKRLVYIAEVESVYSAVRTESLYKQIRFVFKGLILFRTTPDKLIHSLHLKFWEPQKVVLFQKSQNISVL
jgi:hypothetical protein